MAILSNNDIARAIYLVLKDNHLEARPPSGDLASKYDRIVKFLYRKRLLFKAPLILSQLKKIINQEKGRIVAKISSVETLSRQTKMHLEQVFKKRYSAKEVFIEEKLDGKLLGGIRVEINDEVIDLTIKNKISQLEAYLKAT